MTDNTGYIVEYIKKLIDRNGPRYFKNEPYEVYRDLLEAGATDRNTAALILHVLASAVVIDADHSYDEDMLSDTVRKECGINKRKADWIAHILSTVYSDDNKKEWERKNQEGLNQFLKEKFICSWNGFAVWDAGNGTVDCHYEAEITMMPTKTITRDEELSQKLKENPFMTKDSIHELFASRLIEYLSNKFEYYCTEDDYYQPVVEDFGGNMEYDLPEWCKENGFELVAFVGDGDDGGYEPKFRKEWY